MKKLCDNIEINKELFDVIMRLKRQSHGNIKLKDGIINATIKKIVEETDEI